MVVNTEATVAPSTSTETGPTWAFIGTSALAAAVGVVVAALVNNLGIAVGGLFADRGPVLYHNEVVYRAAGSDLALAGGAVACLLVGAFWLTVYPGARRYDGARITVLWIVLHLFREGFSQLALLPLNQNSNMAAVFGSIDVPAGLDLVVAAAGAVGLLSVALASAPAFLAFAHKQRLISTPGNRFSYTAKLALLPGIAGSLVAVPFFLPDNGTGTIQTLPLLGLFTVATVLAALGTRSVRIGDYRAAQGFDWVPLVWLVVMMILFQFVLTNGLLIPPADGAVFFDGTGQ